jgi:hypothetical protein
MREHDKTDAPGLTWALAAAFAVLAVAWRLGPYLLDLGAEATWVWNFTPVGALGLFAGARLRSRWAMVLPLAAMLASDLLLIKPLLDKGYSAFSWGTPVIYSCVLAYALIVRLRRPAGPLWVVGAGVLGAVQFFLVTNFLCWLGDDGTTYPKTLAGVLACYGAGVPFFRTLAGDLLFAGLFFGVYAAALFVLHRQKASQPA